MKKNLILLLFAVCFAVLLCGCTTSVCRQYPVPDDVKSSSGMRVTHKLEGRNYGYYLFNTLPVWCGHPFHPTEGEWDLWRHMLREGQMRAMLEERAELLGASGIDDFKMQQNSTGWWSLWILWRKNAAVSAFAVKK